MVTEASLRLAFAGTPELAKMVLETIIKSGEHEVKRVFTQPDRPAGRGKRLKQSEVKIYALENALPVLQPATAKGIDPKDLDDCDLMLIVAYGLLITPQILASPRLGCINIHTSLLPRWRGAAPIQRAVEAGDTQSGISIMQMDAGLDTGPILEQVACPILARDTARDLHDRLAKISADTINPVLTNIANQALKPIQQDGSLSTYANKISKQEAELDWTRPAVELERKIRAFNPSPVAHARLKGLNMRIWETQIKPLKNNLNPGTILKNKNSLDVVTGKDILAITQLQAPGKKVMAAKDFLNGQSDFFDLL